MAEVATNELEKDFGGVGAVNGISLTVRNGEFMVLLGPSGCGKTTYLRMIAGLEKPSAGQILIAGQVVNEVSPRARGAAMVFQSYGLYPHFKIWDNIAFPLRTQGTPKDEIIRKVNWAAELLGIERLLQRKPRQLSGGERQRVALARAIVRDPSVFLLDEPLSNLDAKLRTMARNELKQFQQRVQTTTIYVTHDQVEAMGMGDRIAVIDHGKVRQVGTPGEIYDNPADTFVATFLGTPPMNLVRRNGGILGFRAEHFLPRELMAADDIMELSFEIHRIEYLGSERVLYGVIKGREGVEEGREITAKVPAHARLEGVSPGQAHDFAIRRRELRYFDNDGRRTNGQA
ncbi:MAG TPA: ABC transporter ATP-binding protein [Alphaproteobacteria bacterium]|nr:ABC transporter ATP-binding protein [Alphaproteobacteria bacterium]